MNLEYETLKDRIESMDWKFQIMYCILSYVAKLSYFTQNQILSKKDKFKSILY